MKAIAAMFLGLVTLLVGCTTQVASGEDPASSASPSVHAPTTSARAPVLQAPEGHPYPCACKPRPVGEACNEALSSERGIAQDGCGGFYNCAPGACWSLGTTCGGLDGTLTFACSFASGYGTSTGKGTPDGCGQSEATGTYATYCCGGPGAPLDPAKPFRVAN